MIKLFEDFNDIKDFCWLNDINDYTINNDGSVDVHLRVRNDIDSVDILQKVDKLPIKFNNISGYFTANGIGLTTLENSPRYVLDSFECSYNKLESLKFSPERVGGVFWCNKNNIKSLKYITRNCMDYKIADNPLPQEIYDNIIHIKTIINNQDDYNIWGEDQTLNLTRFDILMKDIKDGHFD